MSSIPFLNVTYKLKSKNQITDKLISHITFYIYLNVCKQMTFELLLVHSSVQDCLTVQIDD